MTTNKGKKLMSGTAVLHNKVYRKLHYWEEVVSNDLFSYHYPTYDLIKNRAKPSEEWAWGRTPKFLREYYNNKNYNFYRRIG